MIKFLCSLFISKFILGTTSFIGLIILSGHSYSQEVYYQSLDKSRDIKEFNKIGLKQAHKNKFKLPPFIEIEKTFKKFGLSQEIKNLDDVGKTKFFLRCTYMGNDKVIIKYKSISKEKTKSFCNFVRKKYGR